MKRLKNNMWTLLTESPQQPPQVHRAPCIWVLLELEQLSRGCTVAKLVLSQETTAVAAVAEVCGEKTFRETTKMLLNRYKKTCQTELMVLWTEAVSEPVSFHTSKTAEVHICDGLRNMSDSSVCAAAGYQTRWLRICRCHWPL